MMNDIYQAIDIAKKFLETMGYESYTIQRAIPYEKEMKWEVSFKISVFEREVRTIVIDDKNGKILEFR